jgi:hypothetical protein
MKLFQRRPTISASEACAQLSRIVREHVDRPDRIRVSTTFDVEPSTLSRQWAKLALFAVYFALKFSRVRGWRERAQELFNNVSQEVSQQFQFGVLGFETEFQVYGLAINYSGGDPGRVKTEIGKAFCQILGKDPVDNVELLVVGYEAFTTVAESVVALQKQSALV